jgi:cell filamentation protein
MDECDVSFLVLSSRCSKRDCETRYRFREEARQPKDDEMEDRANAPPARNGSSADLIWSRINSLKTATPSRTTAELMWLHHALNVDIFPTAGQLRSGPLIWNGAAHAHPDLIRASLDDRFGELLANNALLGLARDEFIERLAYHVAELHAISPFMEANRRLIGLHALQIAFAAGQNVFVFEVPRSVWDVALHRSFVERQTDMLVSIFRGQSHIDAVATSGRTGPAGIALLPVRTTPRARRYLKNLKVARQEIEALLPEAIRIAKTMLARLERGVVAGGDVVATAQRLACLEHDRGPLFMAALLEAAHVHKIEGVFSDGQSALERVNEITAAMIMAINMLPSDVVDAAAGQLALSRYPEGGSPHQDRLADQFLRNSALTNRLDPRFAPAQRYVDAIAAQSRELAGRQAAEIEAIVEQRRQLAASRIRVGDMLMRGSEMMDKAVIPSPIVKSVKN